AQLGLQETCPFGDLIDTCIAFIAGQRRNLVTACPPVRSYRSEPISSLIINDIFLDQPYTLPDERRQVEIIVIAFINLEADITTPCAFTSGDQLFTGLLSNTAYDLGYQRFWCRHRRRVM